MGLEIHYTKLFNTIEYYEQVLNASYEEMVNLVNIIIEKNDLDIKFEDYDFGYDGNKAELEIIDKKGILLFSSEKYYTGYEEDKNKAKYYTYYKLFQSDFFKGLQK